MSYDVSFYIDTGSGNEVEIGWLNYTSNCSGMWAKALDLPGRPRYNPDGSPIMCKRLDRETGESRPEQSYDFGLALLNGAPASEAAGVLAAAVERMRANPDEYTPKNPENGWGDYHGALDFLASIADMAAAHPASMIRVSH